MSVYAANRLTSIAEDSQFEQEIIEAFADTSRETASLTNYGVIAQLHENDMRMFDAIISADFATVSNSMVLEGAELVAVNEKVENSTAKKIWEKIKSAIKAIKEAILKVARIFRDKILDLIKADKKIVEKYSDAINKNFKPITVKVAAPTKSMIELKIKAEATYKELIADAGNVSTILRGLDDNTPGSGDGANIIKKKMTEEVEDLIKAVSNIDNGQTNTQITADIAKKALDELKGGREIIKVAKDSADKALKVVKAMEKAANEAQSKKSDSPAAGARVYSAVSGTGASVNKAMNTVNNALVKILAANRKIVLAAGRAAKGGVQEAAVLEALFDTSDMYVAEMCEMI